MKVALANKFDKKTVLEFCKNTFSWGDYIEYVWDYWIKEGNLLVIRKNKRPVAMCHVIIFSEDTRIWIEGIRVDKNFRRKGFATILVKESEKLGLQKNCFYSYMLIESRNTNSLKLARKLGYKIDEKWNFFSLTPKKIRSVPKTYFPTLNSNIITPYSNNLSYVTSWRWLPLTGHAKNSLIKQKKIIYSNYDKIKSVAVLTDSDHFDSTLLVTLLSGKKIGLKKILQFIQNFAFKKKYKRIQILTKLKSLPTLPDLEKRLIFYLMKKKLRNKTNSIGYFP